MSTPQYGGPAGRRPLPLSPSPPTHEGGNGARPATVDPWPVPPVDRPGRPRFDGWAGPPPHLDPENQVDVGGERRFRLWPLVLAALGVLVAVGVAATVAGGDGGSAVPTEVGAVRSTDGARVLTSDGARPRALERGETVLYGWTIDAGDGPGVVIDLAAGGVLRFDGGAELTFQATGPGDDRDGDPTVHVEGGRTWFNPAGMRDSAAVALATHDITLRSTGTPVALDCTISCSAEAPAGGVKVSTEDGVNVAPVTDENVMVTSDGGLVMRTIDEPSPWAQQNLEADAAALPRPRAVQGHGVTAGALPAGEYAFDVAITGDGQGVLQHPSLSWLRGETAHFDALVDTEPCPHVPCDVSLTATLDRDGTTVSFEGTLNIVNRSVALTLTRPVECPAEPAAAAPARTVGTVRITVDLTVSEAAYDEVSQHWIATVMGGPGTATTEITDASCAAIPSIAGTRSNELEMTGHAG
jgi:hypothetical protein